LRSDPSQRRHFTRHKPGQANHASILVNDNYFFPPKTARNLM